MVRTLVISAVVVLLVAALVYMAFDGRLGCGCRRLPMTTRMVMHNVQEAVVHYRVDHSDACPSSVQALVGRYLTRSPRDTWGQALAFRCPGPHTPDGADMTSAGPDGRFGTADDLRSWEP